MHVDASCQECEQKERAFRKLQFQLNQALTDLSIAVEEREILLEELGNIRRRMQEQAARDENFRVVATATNIEASRKLLYWAIEQQLEAIPGRTREDGLTLMYRSDLARRTGVSEQTVSAGLKELEEKGAIEKRNEGSGKNERMYIKPVPNARQFVSTEQKHTHGGERICPNCQLQGLAVPLKKHIRVTFECENCGLDYDKDMNPIAHDHTPPALRPTRLEPVAEQPPIMPEPIPIWAGMRRPLSCHCGIKSAWIELGGVSHCTNCEMEYRGARRA